MEEKIKIVQKLIADTTRYNMLDAPRSVKMETGKGIAKGSEDQILLTVTCYKRDENEEIRIDWELWVYENLKTTSISQLKQIASKVRKYMRENR